MKKIVLFIILAFLVSISFSQTIKKGNVIGTHVLNVELKPGVTMGEWQNYYAKNVLSEMSRSLEGREAYLMKGIRGEKESFDVEAEKKAIRDMVATAFKAEQQKDMNTLLNYYSEDVVVQLPNMARIQGIEALKKFYYEFFKILVSIEGGSLEVTISDAGDMAYDYGWNRSVVKGIDGPVEDNGKYLGIYKKINDEWKCVAISASSDKPIM